eukprot:gene8498-17527_t
MAEIIGDGVEHNVSSRFVDYTIASPWESFVAEIEAFITADSDNRSRLSAINEFSYQSLDYGGYHFTLGYYHKDKSVVSNFFSDLFCVNTFYLLSRNRGAVDVASQKRMIFSALVTALEPTRSNIPVFFSSSSVDRIYESREILGYELIKPPNSFKLISGIRHFESHLEYSVFADSNLYYIDGLAAMFEKKLRYTFPDCPLLLLNKIDGEVTNIYHIHASTSFPVPSINLPQRTSLWRSYLKSICPVPAPIVWDQRLLKSLTVHLKYSGFRVSDVVDNPQRTSLTPSHQLPPGAWSLSGVFYSKETVMTHSPSVLALFLRRLTAMFLTGRLSPSDTSGAAAAAAATQTTQSQSRYNDRGDRTPVMFADGALTDKYKLLSLSDRTKSVIEEYLSEDRSNSEKMKSLVEEQLSSRARDIFCPTDHFDEETVEQLPKQGGQSKLFFLCRVALACVCCDTVDTSVRQWLAIIQEARLHWESGMPLPLPSRGGGGDGGGSAVTTSSEEMLPLPLQSLWPGMKHRLLRVGGGGLRLPDIELPNNASPVLEQKFMMIQLCIFLRAAGEDLVTSCPSKWKAGSFDCVLPAPTTATATSRLRGYDAGDDDTGFSDCQESCAPSLDRLVIPRLQFRLHMTSDDAEALQALQMATLDSMGEGEGEGNTNNDGAASSEEGALLREILRIQLRFPALLSDMKAFKAANPGLEVEKFIEWYCSGGENRQSNQVPVRVDSAADGDGNNNGDGLQSEEECGSTHVQGGDDRQVWRLLWSSCRAESAQSQRPLFAIEREAEKALTSLESVAIDRRRLADALFIPDNISTGLDAMVALAVADLESLAMEVKVEAGTRQSSTDDMVELLLTRRNEVLHALTTEGGDEDLVLANTLVALDALSLVMEDAALLCSMTNSCRAVIGFDEAGSELSIALAKIALNAQTESVSVGHTVVTHCCAQTIEEAVILRQLSTVSSSMNAQSRLTLTDGRELEAPSGKSFAFAVTLPGTENNSGLLMSQKMTATVDRDATMRVSFDMVESE